MPFSDDRSIVSCAADGQVLASLILDLFARLSFAPLEVLPAFSFCEKALKVVYAIQEDTRVGQKICKLLMIACTLGELTRVWSDPLSSLGVKSLNPILESSFSF